MLVHGTIDLDQTISGEKQPDLGFYRSEHLSQPGQYYFPQPIHLELIQLNQFMWVYANTLVFLSQVSSMLIQMMMLKIDEGRLPMQVKWIGILERLLIYFVVTEN